jgi:hypothetical protein
MLLLILLLVLYCIVLYTPSAPFCDALFHIQMKGIIDDLIFDADVALFRVSPRCRYEYASVHMDNPCGSLEAESD